jgi:hypothetical protein
MRAGLEENGGEAIRSTSTDADAGLEIWRLCRQYTVVQAALLIAGHDPATAVQVEQRRPDERPPGYEAAKHAIVQALTRDPDMGRAVYLDRTKRYPGIYDPIDVENSTVLASSLKPWLSERGIKTGFLFDTKSESPSNDRQDYLDPDHPRFSPKLAAAVRAWQAIAQAGTPTRISPKRALANWLTAHAKELGLADKSGKSNAKGIAEVAKVANWQTSGGAPRTSIEP